MASTNERVAVLETKVENLGVKVDELKETVNVTKIELTDKLNTMYAASCSQHASLGRDLIELKSFRDSMLARLAGASMVLGPIIGFLISHVDWAGIIK